MNNMVEEESLTDVKRLLAGKLEELKKKRAELQFAENEIADLLGKIGKPDCEKLRTGAPLFSLSLLSCPHCGRSFTLTDAVLDHRYIYQGRLQCACGCEMQIQEGIIQTGMCTKVIMIDLISSGESIMISMRISPLICKNAPIILFQG